MTYRSTVIQGEWGQGVIAIAIRGVPSTYAFQIAKIMYKCLSYVSYLETVGRRVPNPDKPFHHYRNYALIFESRPCLLCGHCLTSDDLCPLSEQSGIEPLLQQVTGHSGVIEEEDEDLNIQCLDSCN